MAAVIPTCRPWIHDAPVVETAYPIAYTPTAPAPVPAAPVILSPFFEPTQIEPVILSPLFVPTQIEPVILSPLFEPTQLKPVILSPLFEPTQIEPPSSITNRPVEDITSAEPSLQTPFAISHVPSIAPSNNETK